jgi:FkbM family methyltransferase
MLGRIVQDGTGLIRILTVQDAVQYFTTCFLKLPRFIGRRKLDLLEVDRTFSRTISLAYKNTTIKVDCAEIDKLLRVENPTFSGIREMYARDVYLRFFDLSKIDFQTVVDAGGNCGLFSIFAALVAPRVVWIEFQDYKYHSVLASLIDSNRPKGQIIEVGALLAGSKEKEKLRSERIQELYRESERSRESLQLDQGTTLVTMQEVLARHVPNRISFLKMDIEGSEFSVMQDADDWLRQVDNLALEVHRDYGDPLEIIRTIDRNDFRVISVNASLKPTEPSKSHYIYASATGALKQH